MALTGRLRPGNAGANDARDHIAVLADALEQLPRELVETATIIMRTDSAGLTHELLDFCRDGQIRFSVGFDLTEPVRAAILALPETAWTAAQDANGEPRTNGQVVELTHLLDLSGGPAGARVIVRRERPHPGAQLSFTDHDGHRFQAILTDQPDEDIAALERRHRARARVEDRIRAAKDCGLENLPFRDSDANAVWLELVLTAQDILYCTQTLALSGELARCEPKRLRCRLLHTAGRLASHARKAALRLPRAWPWARRTRRRVRPARRHPRPLTAGRLPRRQPPRTPGVNLPGPTRPRLGWQPNTATMPLPPRPAARSDSHKPPHPPDHHPHRRSMHDPG